MLLPAAGAPPAGLPRTPSGGAARGVPTGWIAHPVVWGLAPVREAVRRGQLKIHGTHEAPARGLEIQRSSRRQRAEGDLDRQMARLRKAAAGTAGGGRCCWSGMRSALPGSETGVIRDVMLPSFGAGLEITGTDEGLEVSQVSELMREMLAVVSCSPAGCTGSVQRRPGHWRRRSSPLSAIRACRTCLAATYGVILSREEVGQWRGRGEVSDFAYWPAPSPSQPRPVPVYATVCTPPARTVRC